MGYLSDISPSVSKATMQCGEVIAQGQPVAQASDGLIYGVVDPSFSNGPPSWRPFIQTATAYMVPAGGNFISVSSANGGSGNAPPQSQNMAMLSNGNEAIIYSTSGGGIVIGVYTPGGGTILPLTQIATATVDPAAATICALVGGGFAVAYCNNSGNLAFQTFNNAGVGTGVANTAVGMTSSAQISLAPLTNGNFAAVYLAGSVCSTAVYSSICSPVKAFSVTGATTGQQQYPAVAALTGGGFVVYYASSGTTGATAFTIFSNTGAVAVAQTAGVTTQATSGTYSINVVGLAGGGFAMLTTQLAGIQAGIGYQVYNASGVPQGATVTLDNSAGTYSYFTSLAASTNGSFYVAWLNGSAFHPMIANIGANGVQIGASLDVFSAGAAAPTTFNLAAQPDGGVLFLVSLSGVLKAAALSAGLSLQYPISSIGSVAAGYTNCAVSLVPALVPSMIATVLTISGGNVVLNSYAYRVQKQQVVGVSQAASPAGGSPVVQYIGKITLNATFTFPYSAATATNNVISIVGNKAEMVKLAPSKACGYIGSFSNSTLTFTAPVDCVVNLVANAGSSGSISINGVSISSASGVFSESINVGAGSSISFTGGAGSTGVASYVGV